MAYLRIFLILHESRRTSVDAHADNVVKDVKIFYNIVNVAFAKNSCRYLHLRINLFALFKKGFLATQMICK